MKLLLIFISFILISCEDNSGFNIEYPSGGYGFSKNITNRDFYCFPLMDKMSRRDSFWKAHVGAHFFQLFKEPNVSLKPSHSPIVRLAYSGIYTYIINLTENEITVKTGYGSTWPQLDYNKLTQIERIHCSILRAYYPLDEKRLPNMAPAPPPPPGRPEEEIRRERDFDSIKNNTPDLLKREYYDYLLKKAAVKDTFRFETKKLKISKEEFINFITILNQSGYWNLPFDLTSGSCSGATDADFFSVEVNTGKKYNYVQSLGPCIDTSKFYNACQLLLKMAKIDEIRLDLN